MHVATFSPSLFHPRMPLIPYTHVSRSLALSLSRSLSLSCRPSTVHYPFKWLKDGVEIAIGPWDCSLGQHPEELQYCNPLGPDECCEMIQASIGHETDDHGHHLECFVQKQEEPNMQKVVIVVDEVNGQDVVVEDAIPKLTG